MDDHWFVAGRKVEERDRLVTSSTWMLGNKSRRWARVLRFAPVPQTIIEPWPLGTTIHAPLKFQPGLHPLRAMTETDGVAEPTSLPEMPEAGLDALLDRFAAALTANPFLRALPFFMPLRPDAATGFLADAAGRALPWSGHGRCGVGCRVCLRRPFRPDVRRMGRPLASACSPWPMAMSGFP